MMKLMKKAIKKYCEKAAKTGAWTPSCQVPIR